MKELIFSRWLKALSLLLFFAKICSVIGQTTEDHKPAPQDSIQDYKIAAQDIIVVDVVGEKELSREFRVSSSGTITFPYLGNVEVKNKTPAEVETLLREGLDKDYLVDPQVIVNVKEYRIRTFAAVGQVFKPGAISFQGEQKLTLLDAINMAGGFTRLANKNKIEFTRAGKTETYKWDELKDKDPKQLFYLEAGDIIYVRESIF